MSRQRPSPSTAAACLGVLTFSPRPSTRILHSSSTPLAGTFFGILRGTTLHLLRTDPRTTSEDDTADGTEVARIALVARGFNSARRGKGTEVLVERVDGDGDGAAKAGAKQQRSSVVKKRSSPGLMFAESTNLDKDLGRMSFSDKLAMRMGKRAKSISSVGAILLDDPSDPSDPSDVEPLAFSATSTADANQWVAAINSGFTYTTIPSPSTTPLPSPKLATSASLPGGLATFANLRSATSLSSRRPKTAQTILTDGVPADFNAGRRPSFLDRPPPSPRNYVPPNVVTLTAASPPRRGDGPHVKSSPVTLDGSDVPAWIQAVKHARVEPELRARRSMTLVDDQRRNSISFMESTRADEATAEFGAGGGRTGKLLSFLGSKRTKKESSSSDAGPRPFSPSDPSMQPARHLFPPTLYADTRRSNSSASLSDSLSETHSTSASSDFPLTPETTKDFSSSPFTYKSRPASVLGTSTSHPHSFRPISPHHKASSHPRQASTPSQHSRFPSSSDSKPSRAAASDIGHDSSVFPWDEESPVSRQQRDDWRAKFGRRIASSNDLSGQRENVNPRSSTEPIVSGQEYIVKPSELISHMRGEVSDWQPTLSARRSNGALRSSNMGGLPGGLSPTPRSVSSRQLSSGMARSPSKQTLACWPPSSPQADSAPSSPVLHESLETPRVIRRRPTSFGGVEEMDEGGARAEDGGATTLPMCT